MNILEYLKPLSGRTPPASGTAEQRYALVPFFLLANGEAPFDAWRRPDSRIPAGLEPLWREAGAGCQLCAFHAVNVVTLGTPAAERILGEQKAFLDQLGAGLGQRHEEALRRLYQFASQPLHLRDRSGERLEIPSDWRIAVDFLLTSPASPHQDLEAVFSIEGAPSFPEELDVALALDLEYAWAAASERFVIQLQTLEQSFG